MTGEIVKLPDPVFEGNISPEKALRERRSSREYRGEALRLPEIAQLAWAAQGISGSQGIRTTPSAGAIFPLKLYIAAGNIEGLAAGLYRYIPPDHSLEMIGEGDRRDALFEAALSQEFIRQAPAILIFTAVYENMTNRYLKRGIRYVHFEIGHASQNVYIQAVSLGLGTVAIGAFNDEMIKSVLNLDHDEEPLYLMPVGKV